MTTIESQVLRELVEASEPFINDEIVVETTGTIPLMERLAIAIAKAKIVLEQQLETSGSNSVGCGR